MKINQKVTLPLIFIILTVCSALFAFLYLNNSYNDYDVDYISDMVVLFQKYDGDISTLDVNDKFALKRLIVFDYNGKKYGACDVVENKEHNYALLQYETSQQAANAYEKMLNDGLTVDADSLASIDSVDSVESCQYNANYTNSMGIDSFISDFEIESDDVLVAVLDTGVMLEHKNLKDRYYNDGYDFTGDGNSNADYDKNNESVYFHGTFVAGVICDNTMDNVKIVPFKVVPFGTTLETLSASISAIYAATDMGCDVINASYSSSFGATAYERAIEYAVDNGVCVCASAGNDGCLMQYCYPAMTDEVITVSALNSKMSKLASYSNYGAEIDFCAPGTAVYSTRPNDDGSSGYGTYSGTSFSTPYISAVCANIKSINSDLTKSQVYDIMKDFSVDYGDNGIDLYYGNGMPNISNIIYENDDYRLSLPVGTLDIYNGVEYADTTQPWNFVSQKIINVNISENVKSIGSYTFCNMSNADFNYNGTLLSVGDYAFYGCKKLKNFAFDSDVEFIGSNAFGKIDDFSIIGYSNTVAQTYCEDENIDFVSLGCKHDFLIKSFEPTTERDGYIQYTCIACGYTYNDDYFETVEVITGECGSELTYSLNNIGELFINGSGAMYDYSTLKTPWYEYKEDIRTIILGENVTEISPFAFYGCSAIYTYVCYGDSFKVIDRSLYSCDGKTLICCALSSGKFIMPNELESFDATAFLNTSGLTIVANDNFTIENYIVYDNDFNIVMAMSQYESAGLTFENAVTVKEYAFILTSFPETIRVYSTDVILEKYSIGYIYTDEGFVKTELTYYGDVDSLAYLYAKENGFDTNLLNMGSCGDNLIWHYNHNTHTLYIKGKGDMYSYGNRESIGWYDYIESIKTVIIDDSVTQLSSYSFYGAENLTSLTMPLSMNAPVDQTVWYGCESIEKINLTQGSGVMDDYETTSNDFVYTYTPWYISKNLSEINLSNDVEYIGVNAFRECNGISIVTLNDCKTIARCAFYNCVNLLEFTNYSKNTVYASKSLLCFSNDIMTPMTIYCYEDSTTRDYIEDYDCLYITLGCEHSRGLIENSDLPNCCYDVTVQYQCVDCDKTVYSTYIQAQSNGHYVKATVKNTDGVPISDAQVYLNGELSAVTNVSGKFVIDDVKCNSKYNLVIKKHGFIISQTEIEPYKYNLRGTVEIKYGDFVCDGVVNGKDFAYALCNGFDDTEYMDFGTVENEIADISENYNNQSHPTVNDIYNEQDDASQNRRVFCSNIVLGNEYTVTQCGYVYGKNMDDDFMILDNVGVKNDEGYALKNIEYNIDASVKALVYGSSDSTGKVSARFYIVYTNGVKEYVHYSDVSTYYYQ